MQLPQDDAILFSFLNMKLRDRYSSLQELCEDLEVDEEALFKRLSAIGYTYDKVTNRIM